MIFKHRNDLGMYVGSSLANDYYVANDPRLGLRIRMVESDEDSGYQSYGADDVFNAESTRFDVFVHQLKVGQLLAQLAALIIAQEPRT